MPWALQTSSERQFVLSYVMARLYIIKPSIALSFAPFGFSLALTDRPAHSAMLALLEYPDKLIAAFEGSMIYLLDQSRKV